MTRVFDSLGPEGWGSYRVTFDDGGPQFERVHEKPTGLLIPGFVDGHFHGAFGIDFMSATESEWPTLIDALRREGYEFVLPTTITATCAEVRAAVDRLPDHPLIAGFHLEGPFISPKHPGAQPPPAIAAIPDGDSDWDAVLGHPRLRQITLAPEIPGALELILRLQKRGVVVSMGHTDATYEEARRGFEFGVTLATHTFNAMRGFHHREAGAVGYCLSNPDLHCELIYDRVHVSREAAAILIRNKREDSIIAVSDCSMAGGLPPGTELTMWGHQCVVGQHDVRLLDGTLAGSTQTLLAMFRNWCEDFGPEIAVRACCLNARRLFGLPAPRLWLHLSPDYRLVEQIPC